GVDQGAAVLLRDVVVVALEPAPRDPVGVGEGVQLVERLVTDQVAPASPPVPPACLVDQDHDRQPRAAGATLSSWIESSSTEPRRERRAGGPAGVGAARRPLPRGRPLAGVGGDPPPRAPPALPHPAPPLLGAA